MKLEASSEIKQFGKKPHIQKGFYHAILKEIKLSEDESKYGKQVIFLFEIDHKDHPVLATKAHYLYRNQDGTYKTAINPGTRSGKIFGALGYNFEGQIETDKLIGNSVEVLIDDYEYDFEDFSTKKKEKLTGSAIKEVNKLRMFTEENVK